MKDSIRKNERHRIGTCVEIERNIVCHFAEARISIALEMAHAENDGLWDAPQSHPFSLTFSPRVSVFTSLYAQLSDTSTTNPD